MDKALRILIVDDDEFDRINVRRSLRSPQLQIEFTEATSYAMAIHLLQQENFNCIFLDYYLPDKDGLSLIRELQDKNIRVPVIVLTGQGDEAIAVELMKAGAIDYLAKGKVSADTLPRLLQNAVRLHRAEMETERAYERLRRTNDILQAQNEKLRQHQRQIRMQNLQLLEASRLKSQFLATMSHELRTPLNAIIGFSQILQRRYRNDTDSKSADMLQRILNNGKHLLELINDILDLSKIEAGHLSLKPEPFDLAGLVHTTVDELHSLADSKQLPIRVNIQLTDTTVKNDSGRFRQVLTNLLSNAIKFTDTGEVRIELWDLPENRVAIAVRDTGIGIAPEHQNHIFEPFRQVDQTTTRKHAGTGLGLAITESLVQMMGGEISVTSELGTGTTFQVIIPRQIQLVEPPLPLTAKDGNPPDGKSAPGEPMLLESMEDSSHSRRD